MVPEVFKVYQNRSKDPVTTALLLNHAINKHSVRNQSQERPKTTKDAYQETRYC